MAFQLVSDDLYSVSWSNPAWSHYLCSANILDYFCDLSNPFYDRQCNNEVIRMQRLHPEQMLNMTGIEFYLHHAQEPILFVIRKQQRLSNTQVTPLAYYYVINGTVLQEPDLRTLLNSRLLTTVTGLKKVLQSLVPYARFHPSDGSYSWDDPNIDQTTPTISDSKTTSTDDVNRPVFGNLFQVQRTDALLADWMTRFPVPSANFLQNALNTNSQTPKINNTPCTPIKMEENAQINHPSPLKTPSKSASASLQSQFNLSTNPLCTNVVSSNPVQSISVTDRKPRI